jgi:glyoxylase-like metal-dependent hydrolase (beta-lactamase superfamily II)
VRVIRLEVGPLASNAYLLRDDASPAGAVIDPGGDGDRIAARCRNEGIEPELIVNTHGHADHIAGNEAVKAEFPSALLAIGSEDAPMLTNGLKNLAVLLGASLRSPDADLLLEDGLELRFGSVVLKVIHTPGHTPGGVSLLADAEEPGQLFCGDLVFRESVGRADLPGGDFGVLLNSIRTRVLTLPDDTVIRPGHGPETTVGHERRYNPYLA